MSCLYYQKYCNNGKGNIKSRTCKNAYWVPLFTINSVLLSMFQNYVKKQSRISGYVFMNKLRLIMNAFFSSQFEYCPLVWMFHNLSLSNRTNKLQESALRVVHKENTFTIHQITTHLRNTQNRAIEVNNHIVYGMIIYAEHTMLKLYNTRLKKSFMKPKTSPLVPSNIEKYRGLRDI